MCLYGKHKGYEVSCFVFVLVLYFAKFYHTQCNTEIGDLYLVFETCRVSFFSLFTGCTNLVRSSDTQRD